MIKNAIILAGGTGSRLFPLTHVVNKHLIDVNGKFIIDYPINTLKQMGVENLTVVLGGNHFSQVVDHLKDGSSVGMNINYVYQGKASGIAQAINLCKRYVQDDNNFSVILGDNIYGNPIFWNEDYLDKAQIVLWDVPDLQRFGVASTDILTDEIIKIEEKPTVLDTKYNNFAITGCYLFDHRFFDYFRHLKPSARGEFEIVDIIKEYHHNGALHPTWSSNHMVKGGVFWSDAGTHESIAKCNQYFYDKQNRNPQR